MFACECAPQADGRKVSGRALSQQSVDGKDGGDGGQSPDARAQGWGLLPAGHERSWAQWVGAGARGEQG